MKGPISKPKISLGLLEVITILAGLVVLLGLTRESGKDWLEAIHRRVWPSNSVEGNFLVAFGVFVETATGIFIARSAKRAEREAKQRIAELNDRAAKAEQAAADANLRALTLREKLRTRILTIETQEALVRHLTSYGGEKRVDILGFDSHMEGPRLLADQLNSVFTSSGWKTKCWLANGHRMLGEGIVFAAAREADADTSLKLLCAGLPSFLVHQGLSSAVSFGGFSLSDEPPSTLRGDSDIAKWDPEDVSKLRIQISGQQIASGPFEPEWIDDLWSAPSMKKP